MDKQLFGTNGENPVELQDDEFEESPKTFNTIIENDCLGNSYNMHLSNGDKMVEGVVVILEDGKLINAVTHCWNKSITTGKYYDITKDTFWNTPQHLEKLREEGVTDKVTYRYLKGKEYDKPNENKGKEGQEVIFYYDYTCLVDFLTRG